MIDLQFLTSRYWKDVLWQASGNSLAQLIGIVGIPLLSRLYEPSAFGLQSIYLQLIMFVSGFIALRYEYLIPLPSRNEDALNIFQFVFKISVVVCLFLTPIFFYCRFKIAYFIQSPQLEPWLVLIPFCGLIVCLATAAQLYLQKVYSFRISAISELIGKASYILGAAIGGLFSHGIVFLLFAPVYSAGSKLLYILKVLRSENFKETFSFRGPRKTDFGLIGRYRAHSYNLIFSHFLLTITGALPILFIGRQYGATTLGYFSLVCATLYLPSGLLGAAVGQVYYQKAAKVWGGGEKFSDLFMDTIKKLMLIGVPVYFLAAILSPILYSFVFGAKWAAAGGYASIMCLSAFFSFVTSPFDKTSLIVHAPWYPSIWHSLRVITTVLLIYITFNNHLNFNTFLIIYTIQMTLMYLVDGVASWHFSTRTSKHASIVS